MRFDLLSGLRKWRLIGALALILVAITSISTTVHALQHVVSANAATINPGDSEACGLCHLETTVSPRPNLKITVVMTGLTAYTGLSEKVGRAPQNALISHTLRGPPAGA